MKNATCYCAGPAYYRMCSTDVYCSKQTAAAVAPKETITHHFFVSGIGQKWKKLSMQPKFVAAQKMLLKQKLQQTFVNGLLGFITLGIYTRWKRVCIVLANNCTSCPSIWATLSALLINILLGSFQLFLHSDQPLSEGEITCLAVFASFRGLPYPRRRRRGFTHWLTDCLMCNRRRPAATSRRASFSALASANSFLVYFASSAANITLTHLHVSNCRVRQLQFSGILVVALGFVGNGVITVMINSPWQADDDADNQSGDNRGDSAYTSISLTVPPASLNFAQLRRQPYARTDHNQRPAVKPSDIAATVDCLTDITTINHRQSATP